MKKKLIEVALPLDAINAAADREKRVKVGKPLAVHHWWARRPLTACRAVLFAQLVDDPSAHTESFPSEADQDIERQRLFGILEDLIKWENSNDPDVLRAARTEIRRSCGDTLPPVLDPFAGGGSIPLEAQRLGLEAHASDLNPVAVLINRALIELPPKFANLPPVHPEGENKTGWAGADGLAEDVRRYGEWMRDEAAERIGHLYPKALLADGSEANVVAWIWAQTVTCPNPGCRATMPLVRSFWLCKKRGKEAWARPIVDASEVRFEVAQGPAGPEVSGTVDRSGAKCLACGEAVKLEYLRSEAKSGRMGKQLMAIAAEGKRRRVYLAPSSAHVEAAAVKRPLSAPSSKLPEKALGFRVQAYGMTTHADLFTNRQLCALTTFSDLLGDVKEHVLADAQDAGFVAEQAVAYSNAVATYLALNLGRLCDWNNQLSRWEPNAQVPQQLFARQAIPMVWDFSEANPLGRATGSLVASLVNQTRALAGLGVGQPGRAYQQDARDIEGTFVLATDPPYYDNIGYADLADFFYVWLREFVGELHPELFGTMLTPKAAELIATPHRHDEDRAAADKYFENGFIEVFQAARKAAMPGFPLTFFYAFKQSEATDDGIASTGWSTMLEGLQAAGWMVTATWPMRTEMASRMRGQGSNALASSVVLACRPRPDSAGITDRQGFLRVLREELPGPIGELQKAAVAPVDLRQAAIGPGMAVFSRFAKVIEPNGEPMRVRVALGLINQVLETVLGEQEADFDPETRWAIQWFSQFLEDQGPFGTAESLAVSMNVSVDGLVSSGILESGGGKARLLSRNELPDDWDPATDDRVPLWEATQHLIRRLESEGEVSAARLFRQLGGMAD
ncbi:MAG: DUF1156 domain-containing protein, partial [Chloroflexi bacterium]|nr:DUF1156 domain-containing protein [Chloroflexota bacterium]